MEMPVPDAHVLARKAQIVARLEALLGPEAVISTAEEVRAYECDALTAYRCPPLAVLLPRTTEEIADAVRVCAEEGVPIVPRGAGTSLAGGSLPTADSVLLGVSRLNRVLDVDYANRVVHVQTGITNLAVTGAVQGDGFFYAPDPSSQLACAIAGNIAMNSGGAHCLKYGVTTNNLLGVRMVTADGHIVQIGGPHLDAPGYDLLGPDLRLGGPARHRHRGVAAHPGEARGRASRADGLRQLRDGRRLRRRHHPLGRHPRRHRVHGPPLHPRHRGARPCRLSHGRRGPADRRGRGRGGRDRGAADRHQGGRQPARPDGDARGPVRGRGRRHLARPQIGLRRDGPARRLYLPRRHGADLGPAGGAAPDGRALAPVRAQGRQCLSRRRRQHASPDRLRRQQGRARRAPRRWAPTY